MCPETVFDKWPLTLNFPLFTITTVLPKHPMPGQALALQGFPGIVYIRRGGIHRSGKCRKAMRSPAG